MRIAAVAATGEEVRPLGTAFHAEILARRYYRLFNERRLDDAERMIDPQAVFTSPLASEQLLGRAGYRELVRRWLDAFPDASVRIERVRVRPGLVVAVDLLARGVHDGLLQLPGFAPVRATGREASLTMRDTTTFENGLIVKSVLELDPAALRGALGL